MIIYPLQSFGIGDIIFTMTLVKKIAGKNRILWGTEPQFVEGLNRAYPDVLFVDKKAIAVDYERKDDYIINGMRVLPIRWADQILKLPYKECMRAKYALYQQEWTTWTEDAYWERNEQRETELFSRLGLKDGQEYTLINRFFGSSSQYAAGINDRGVEMCLMQGYSLFDWAKVIEKASAIHSVSTSLIYLLELLELKAEEVHLYPRIPICNHFNDVDYILQKQNYICHV